MITRVCKLLAPNYREGRKIIGRSELERREHYMRMIYSQLREQHPLLGMAYNIATLQKNTVIMLCMIGSESERPNEKGYLHPHPVVQVAVTH